MDKRQADGSPRDRAFRLGERSLFDPTPLYVVGATEFAIPALQSRDQRRVSRQQKSDILRS